MGNIRTHAQISAHVIAQLTSVRPDEDYLYLELGNFLTDVSQFRDPYACVHAKRSVLLNAVMAKFPVPILGLPLVGAAIRSWKHELLGEAHPQERRYGALTRFLALMARSATHLIFAEDSPLAARILGSLGLSLHLLPPAEVEHYLDTALTQYYPHEHVDYPPYRDPDKEPLDERPRRQVPDSTRQIAYLRDHIQYIVEQLTNIELEWVRRRSLATSDRSRHDILVRLGHVLHSIEDYYFHSNFAEIYQWGHLVDSNRGRLTAGQTDRDGLLLRGLDGITDIVPEGMSATRQRRRLARRLRYPVFDRGLGLVTSATYWSSPSKKSSQDATALVYTGGFGGNDIFHSISSGLVAFEELIDTIGTYGALEEELIGTHRIRQRSSTDLVLVRVLLSQEERRRMVTEKGYEARLLQQHAAQLRDGRYLSGIQSLLDTGKVSKATADALKAAFQLDWELERKYKLPPGVGGFLIMLLSSLQREVDESQNRADVLDRADKSILDQATSNGASAETIGTHSLLAKDDKGELPLRAAAVALAKHASASVSVLMAKRVNTETDERKGLDWDSIVHHFLRCPQTWRQSWETSIISSLPGPMPDIDAVRDRPNYRMLGPDFRPEKLKALREGTKRKELEGYYQKLENLEDRGW